MILTRTQAASTAMPESESLAYLAETRATMIIHLAIRRIRQICVELVPAYGPDCPVAVVANATQPTERVLRGNLLTIADQVESAGLRQAAVIMIGQALHGGGVASHLPPAALPVIKCTNGWSTPSRRARVGSGWNR